VIRPVGQSGVVAPQTIERRPVEVADGFDGSLNALLERPAPAARSEAVGFSRHAVARMESRGITLDEQDMADLESTLDKLQGRGARESLVLLGDNAFIVGVNSRRVITAMTRSEAAGNVFTQIDATVVIR
jgi:flagellar operon protein